MADKKKFRYFTQVLGFNKAGTFIPTLSADITFSNIGTTVVTVDQVPLNFGDSMTDSAFGDELNVTHYTIVFADNVDCQLIVKEKIYQND